MESVTARLLARRILQEYDAFAVDELAVNPAESEKLAARHNLVEIAEAAPVYPMWQSYSKQPATTSTSTVFWTTCGSGWDLAAAASATCTLWLGSWRIGMRPVRKPYLGTGRFLPSSVPIIAATSTEQKYQNDDQND